MTVFVENNVLCVASKIWVMSFAYVFKTFIDDETRTGENLRVFWETKTCLIYLNFFIENILNEKYF